MFGKELSPWKRREDPWRPLEDMRGFMESMTRSLSDPWSRMRRGLSRGKEDIGAPEIALEDTPTEFIVSAQVAGIAKEALRVEVNDNVLTIRGQQKDEKEYRKHGGSGKEQYFASFARSFTLPAPVKAEEVRATYRDGVLEIRLPKVKETTVCRVKIG